MLREATVSITYNDIECRDHRSECPLDGLIRAKVTEDSNGGQR